MAKEPRQADFGPEADAAARAEAGAPPTPATAPVSDPAVNLDQEKPSNDPNVKGAAPGQTPGGVEVELISDYWPAEQPPVEQDPRKLAVENRLRAGERVTLPQDEVMNLLERGLAKRVQK
jgi:hypothetical protein